MSPPNMASVGPATPHCGHFPRRGADPPVMVRSMKVSGFLVVVASMAAAAPDAAADPVVDAFYNRCVSENAYQMAPNELEGACACMAPVMVSFLTDDARRRLEEAI